MNGIKNISRTPESDEILVKEYQENGDLDVFTKLFLRYHHLVLGICMKYLNDIEESKDTVQDLFEKVSEDLKKHEIESFRGWLYVTARNHCLMKIRRDKGIGKATENEFILERVVESDSTWHPIYEGDVKEEMDKALSKCLDELAELQHTCIKLFYFDNMSYQELSERLQIDLKKVKSYLQNGKRNLKICIDKEKS